MVLLELSIIVSLPKRFKYRRSVSTRTNETVPVEESERRELTVPFAEGQGPFPQRNTSRDV
jgi:hypothetical protein